jgi:hypothetical protein
VVAAVLEHGQTPSPFLSFPFSPNPCCFHPPMFRLMKIRIQKYSADKRKREREREEGKEGKQRRKDESESNNMGRQRSLQS